MVRNKCKKVISIAVLTVMITATSLNVFAGGSLSEMLQPNSSQLQMSESGSCGKNVTYKFNVKTGKLTISGNGKMDNFSDSKTSPWSIYRDKIKSIKIENGVTEIGSYAFDGCKHLTEIYIGNDIVWIGDNAFRGFSNLITVYVCNILNLSPNLSDTERIGLDTKNVQIIMVYRFGGNCDSDTDISMSFEADKDLSVIDLN